VSRIVAFIVKNIDTIILFACFFQRSLFLRITTLLTWLKSTLLLKNKCFDKHIFMKTQCLQTNETQHYCEKENAWGAGWVRKEVALIKGLIYASEKKTRLRRICMRSTKVGRFYQLTFCWLSQFFNHWNQEKLGTTLIFGLSCIKSKNQCKPALSYSMHCYEGHNPHCVEQACTTYGPRAKCGPQKLLIWPAKPQFGSFCFFLW